MLQNSQESNRDSSDPSHLRSTMDNRKEWNDMQERDSMNEKDLKLERNRIEKYISNDELSPTLSKHGITGIPMLDLVLYELFGIMISIEFILFVSQALIRFSYTTLDVTLHQLHPTVARTLLSTGTLFYAISKFFSGFLIDNITGGVMAIRIMFLVGFVSFMIFYFAYPDDLDLFRFFTAVMVWNIYRATSCSSWAATSKVIVDTRHYSWISLAARFGSIFGMIGLGTLLQFIGEKVWLFTGLLLGAWCIVLFMHTGLKDNIPSSTSNTNTMGRQSPVENRGNAFHTMRSKDVEFEEYDTKVEHHIDTPSMPTSHLSHHTEAIHSTQRKPSIRDSSTISDSNPENGISSALTPSDELSNPSSSQALNQSLNQSSNQASNQLSQSVSQLDQPTQVFIDIPSTRRTTHPLQGMSSIEALKYFITSHTVYKVALFMMSATILSEMQSHFPLYLMKDVGVESSRAVVSGSAFSTGFVFSMILVTFLFPQLQLKNKSYYLISTFSLTSTVLFILAFVKFSSLYIAAFLIFLLGFGIAPTYYIPFSSFCTAYGGKFSATLMGLVDTSSFGSSVFLHAYIASLAESMGWMFVFRILFLISIMGCFSLYSYLFSNDVKL